MPNSNTPAPISFTGQDPTIKLPPPLAAPVTQAPMSAAAPAKPVPSGARQVKLMPGDRLVEPTSEELLRAAATRVPLAPVLAPADLKGKLEQIDDTISKWESSKIVWGKTIVSSFAINALLGARLLARMLLGRPPTDFWSIIGATGTAEPAAKDSGVSLQIQMEDALDRLDALKKDQQYWINAQSPTRYSIAGARALLMMLLCLREKEAGVVVNLWNVVDVNQQTGRQNRL